MKEAFGGMALASGLHALGEYVYPGGFLVWLLRLFPKSAPSPAGAVVINSVFFLFVLSPLFGSAADPSVISLSIAGLLLAVTAALCYFPAAFYALATLPRHSHMGTVQLAEALVLGAVWQAIPVSWMLIRG
jgi:hypothetical protein